MRKEATAATRAVWREVSYSLRETQAPSPTSDYREGRAKVSHQIDSFERVQPVDGQVGAIFSARAASGIVWARRTCLGACPRSSELRLRGAQRRGSRQRAEDVAASWWAGMQGGPVRGAPSPGAAMTSRIDTGEVIGSGLYWNHRPPVVLSGAGPGTFRAAGPPACPAGQRSRNLEALGASGRQQDAPRVAPVATPLHALTLFGGPERRASARNPAGGNRLATGPGTVSPPPSAGYSSAPRFASRYRQEVPASRGKLRSRPGEQFRHPSAGCSSTPVSRVGAAEDMRAAELWTQSVRERFTPSAGCFLPARPGSEFPTAVSGSHAPDQVPDSVTDIDRPAAGADPPRGP